MKKLVAIVVVALVLVAGVGPWLTGRMAHSRVDKGLQTLVEKVPYIKVVERKWQGGWFTSKSTVTFEFVLPGAGNKPVAALADAAPAPLPADEPAPQAIPKFPAIAPVRFTVNSDVLHGPVLGGAGIGLARLDTRLALSEQIRTKLIEVLGTDEPVRIRTRMAFLGGGTTTLSGEGRTIQLEKLGGRGKGTMAWEDFSMSVGMARGAKSYDMKGRQPRIEFRNGAEHVLFSGLELDGKGRRVTEDLYDGKGGFGIGKMSITTSRSPAVEINRIRYDIDSKADGDYFDYALRMGSGEVKAAQLEAMKFQLKEVHYDLTLRHLHIPTLQKFTRSLREAYSTSLGNAVGAEAALMGPLAEHGRELLKHDPEFVIDRFGIVTPEGEAAFKGSVKLPGVTEEDLAAGALSLLPKLVADIRFEAPQALFESLPNGNMMMGMGLDQGYLKREGNKVTSHIEFRNGKLSVNGKSPSMPPMFGGRGAGPDMPDPEAEPIESPELD